MHRVRGQTARPPAPDPRPDGTRNGASSAVPPAEGPSHEVAGLPVPSARAALTALVGGAIAAPFVLAADHALRFRRPAAAAPSAEAHGTAAGPGADPPNGPIRTRPCAVPLVDGTRVSARVTSGPRAATTPRTTTLVLTHGLACDQRLWDQYVPLLAPGGTVVTWDYPGHGSSPRPADGSTHLRPAALAAALCSVVDATAPVGTRVVLVGHSLGGFTTLLALRDHPGLRARVDAAVLIATPLTDLGRTMGEGGRFPDARTTGIRSAVSWALGNGLAQQWFSHPANAIPTYGLVRTLGFGPRPDPAQVRRLRGMLAATPAPIRRAALTGTFGVDLRGTLARITVPVLVVVGDQDRLVPPRHSCDVLAELPDSRLVRFAGAGHAVVLERAEEIVAHIRMFLQHTASAAG